MLWAEVDMRELCRTGIARLSVNCRISNCAGVRYIEGFNSFHWPFQILVLRRLMMGSPVLSCFAVAFHLTTLCSTGLDYGDPDCTRMRCMELQVWQPHLVGFRRVPKYHPGLHTSTAHGISPFCWIVYRFHIVKYVVLFVVVVVVIICVMLITTKWLQFGCRGVCYPSALSEDVM